MKNKLTEEVPVTTTDNAGSGLTEPKLPIKPNNILKRYKDMKKKSEEK